MYVSKGLLIQVFTAPGMGTEKNAEMRMCAWVVSIRKIQRGSSEFPNRVVPIVV